MSGDTIGRGTWIDKLASELVAREKELGRGLGMIRVESGLGASGVPHIGSLGDAVRAYGVRLALENLGYDSELVAYSDDLDGLRKVPAGFDASLEEEIGRPVSSIPDPSGCHDSYGAHMSGLLLEALDRLGIEYTHVSARDAYSRGTFAEGAQKILASAARIGAQIAGMTGQEKFRTILPYYPICSRCGRLYTTSATGYDGDRRVSYRCGDAEIAGRTVRGCGNSDEADVTGGGGKLAWKVEFAARWAALDVRFEAYGKDIMDSVMVNDWVSENVLGHAHPHHARYEMFLDRAGGKISKSAGNVLTPQAWLRYGTPQSLLLLLFKRIAGARRVGVEDVPALMDELAALEAAYFGAPEPNKERAARQRGLYEYAHLLSPPDSAQARPSYSLLVELARVFAEDRDRHVSARLVEYGIIPGPSAAVSELVRLAGNYADDFGSREAPEIEIDAPMRAALAAVADALDSGAEPGEAIRTAASESGVRTRDLFRTLYLAILGVPSGPRLAKFIGDVGASRTASKIRGCL